MRALIGMLLLGAAGTMSACNTISGIGEDINSLGRGVTKGADDTQKKM
jgi:predicted small secreted protein